ncbi:hypothetical protein HZC09_02680 [Candidatus Micrarchaeota archaeon]|nr:hypothetical protein [Candidatus Micrarchaeota archaeon]
MLNDPKWASALNETLIESNTLFFEESEKVLHENLKDKPNEELTAIYEKLLPLQWRGHTAGVPWVVVEFEHQLFTNYLLEYLKNKGKHAAGKSTGEMFSMLTTPTEDSFAQKEEKSLLKIAAQIKKSQNLLNLFNSPTKTIETQLPSASPEINSLIEEHFRAYCWLPYMYEGPAWKKSYFIEVLKGLLKEGVEALLKKAESRHAEAKKSHEKLMKELKVDEKHRALFYIAKGMVFTKAYRKDCLYHFFYCIEPFLKEAAKRAGVTLRQIRRLAPWEFSKAIKEGAADADEANRRWKHAVLYITPGKNEIMTGKKAEEFMASLDMEKPPEASEMKELKGDCACPGFAKGVVKVINTPEEMKKMKKGDVLVAHATNPDIVPAMKLASAIITDLGGITCHAAIVSRELKIPCVIGTKVATSWVKDGDLVEVDATHGVVRKLS